jgi:hypothetical protein
MNEPLTPRRPRARADGFTPARQEAFLTALALGASVKAAAALVGLSRESAYRLRRHPGAAGFRRAWDDALSGARPHALDAARDSAINGVETPVFHRGRQVGSYRRFDDRMLLALLRRDDRVLARLARNP